MTDWLNQYIISLVVFLPLLFAVPVVFVSKDKTGLFIALFGSILTFFLSLHLWFYFDANEYQLQFVEKYTWIASLGVQYFVGLDGLNLLLVMLTTFLTPCVLLSLWTSEQSYLKSLVASLLLLETGMLGALVSLDMVLFYIFWELMLIPMYFMIGIWGGANRIYATTKFVIYTVVGSLLMLVAAIVLYVLHYKEFGFYSTSLLDFYKLESIGTSLQYLLFSAFALAFAIKVPIWPFHTWLPHAHTEAPTCGSVILAGVLLKMGTYGFLRFALPLFPEALQYFAPFLLALGVIGIIYGALMAWMQEDAKKLVAYSSISHLGFVVIGSLALIGGELSAEALTGAIYQMINHGISTGALFFLIGMIYERRHSRQLSDFGGLATVLPLFSVCLIVATLGSVGLPGTGGFVGEFLILLGVFTANPTVAVFAATGVVLGAVYMLTLVLKIIFGPITHPENEKLLDMTFIEKLYMYPLCFLIIVMGVCPNFFLEKTRASIDHFAQNVSQYQLQVKDDNILVESLEGSSSEHI